MGFILDKYVKQTRYSITQYTTIEYLSKSCQHIFGFSGTAYAIDMNLSQIENTKKQLKWLPEDQIKNKMYSEYTYNV